MIHGSRGLIIPCESRTQRNRDWWRWRGIPLSEGQIGKTGLRREPVKPSPWGKPSGWGFGLKWKKLGGAKAAGLPLSQHPTQRSSGSVADERDHRQGHRVPREEIFCFYIEKRIKERQPFRTPVYPILSKITPNIDISCIKCEIDFAHASY